MIRGQIIKIISNDYTVQTSTQSYVCKSRGKFRNLKITPLVGDFVEFDEKNKYILEILPRKNELLRPPVANIDQAFIITSVKDPDFSTNLLDKLLTIIEFHNIKPIICLTKMDLLEQEEQKKLKQIKNHYQNIGYLIFENTEIKEISALFQSKTNIFTGQSGAGKSTLINSIDSSFNLKTADISYALGRGKHTTRHTELLPLSGGLVADTPGFSSLSFYDMEKEDIRDQYPEFNLYKEDCEYRDCMHTKEPKCMVKEKVADGTILKSRYENYLQFLESKKRG